MAKEKLKTIRKYLEDAEYSRCNDDDLDNCVLNIQLALDEMLEEMEKISRFIETHEKENRQTLL